jgi:hypothetical protein
MGNKVKTLSEDIKKQQFDAVNEILNHIARYYGLEETGRKVYTKIIENYKNKGFDKEAVKGEMILSRPASASDLYQKIASTNIKIEVAPALSIFDVWYQTIYQNDMIPTQWTYGHRFSPDSEKWSATANHQ